MVYLKMKGRIHFNLGMAFDSVHCDVIIMFSHFLVLIALVDGLQPLMIHNVYNITVLNPSILPYPPVYFSVGYKKYQIDYSIRFYFVFPLLLF